jgi:hypothetical protein
MTAFKTSSQGAFICLNVTFDARRAAADAPIPALVEKLGLRNEFEPGDEFAICGFLRRVTATSRQMADDRLLHADAVVHVGSENADVVTTFCAEIDRLLGASVTTHIIGGVVRPPKYTGNAMHNFANAHRVLQQSGTLMPNAFLVPMSKTADWWQKEWMERHTYFLPRYDDSGHMISEGHVLASAAGIACLMRRTYWHPTEPAPSGTYDFVNYFECTDADVPIFQNVCAALRDVKRNPEWFFVREGPTWQGRRVATWRELFL